MENLIVQGLCKQYPKFKLDQASFTVREGEIMGLIGRNGAGKSTTLKCLTGLVHPDAGEIRFFGKPLTDREAISQRIAFMTGGVDYYVHKRLESITAVTKAFYGDRWDNDAYCRYMKMFQLDESKTPTALSAGMRVKYSLTLAMSHRAELLILDEPTSGLDPISRDDLTEIFLQLRREGVSILFSTHITADLDKCADRITYIHDGRVLVSKELEEFARQYRLVSLNEAEAEKWQPHLIGRKVAKQGYTALILAEEAPKLPLQSTDATLDDIMVHLEKENDQ